MEGLFCILAFLSLLLAILVMPLLRRLRARKFREMIEEALTAFPEVGPLDSPHPFIVRLRSEGHGWTAVITFSPGLFGVGAKLRAVADGIPTGACSRVESRFASEVPPVLIRRNSPTPEWFADEGRRAVKDIDVAAEGRSWLIESRERSLFVGIDGQIHGLDAVSRFLQGAFALTEGMIERER